MIVSGCLKKCKFFFFFLQLNESNIGDDFISPPIYYVKQLNPVSNTGPGRMNVFIGIIGKHFLSDQFSPNRPRICISLGTDESSSEFWCLYRFETPFAESQAPRHQDFLHEGSSSETHLPRTPLTWLQCCPVGSAARLGVEILPSCHSAWFPASQLSRSHLCWCSFKAFFHCLAGMHIFVS